MPTNAREIAILRFIRIELVIVFLVMMIRVMCTLQDRVMQEELAALGKSRSVLGIQLVR